MNQKSLLTMGRVLNILLIITSLSVFVYWKASEILDVSYDALMLSILVYRIVATVILIASILIFIKGRKEVKGLDLLLASAVIMFVLSMISFVLGIVIWILSGISLKKLAETTFESDFENNLSDSNSSQ